MCSAGRWSNSRRSCPSRTGTTLLFARPDAQVVPALINGGPGVVVLIGGKRASVMSFAVSGGRIVEISALVDPDRLAMVDLSALGI
jgi:hypothetical protein